MAVKTQFKQTDVGTIPSDWELKQLGSIAEVSAGGTPSRGVPEYWNGSIPWVTTTEVDFGRIEVTSQYISELGLKSSAAKLLKPGTILLALYGQGKTRGKVAILDIEATSNQACAAIVLSEKVSRPFVFSYLASRYDFIRGLSNTGNQENLNGVIVKSIPIPLPPTLHEQDAIANALSDADAWIESLEQLIAKKRQVKQGAMQELLTGKRRLPGFSGEWETKRFGELTSLRNERVDPRRCGPFDFCIELEHIGQGTGRLVSSASTTSTSSLKSLFKSRDVLFGKLRAYLRKYWIANSDGVCSTEIWVFTPRTEQITTGYLFQMITVDSFIDAASTAYGTHMPRSDWNVVKNYELRLPSPVEQTAIATILSEMDAEIESLESKLAKAREVKHGMMQELLTGRIRLV